ncbi:type III CRISPR-associated RAMP protein Csx7 [Thermoflexus hugenholtzii]
MFDRFESLTVIRALLHMETPLAVGARAALDPVGADLPVIKDPGGLPFIPGSSLKGVVRSHLERLLRAVHRPPDLWACDPVGDPCVSGARKQALVEAARSGGGFDDQRFTSEVLRESCTACRLFGSPWLAGRLAFKDAPLAEVPPGPLTRIRDGIAIDRDLGTVYRGLKYEFEVVIPGTVFRIEIIAENLRDEELGLLLTALRFWEEGFLPLGGKRARGIGWGRLEIQAVEQIQASRLLDYLMKGEKLQRSVEELREAFARWCSQGA